MPSAQRAVTINRPIEKVFVFVANGENGPKWRSAHIEIRRASGEGVGAVYRQTVPGPGGRRIAADYEVTSYEPPTRIAFRTIAGPVRPSGEYRLERAGEGATRITFSLDAQLSGWKRLLMGGAVQRTTEAEMGSFDRLKSVLEAG